MRPRMSIASLIWIAFSLYGNWKELTPRAVDKSPYHRTAKDVALAECLLNIISWPFAIHFSNNQAALAEKCTVKDLLSANPSRFYGPLGLVTFLGALSTLLLGWGFVRYVASRSKESTISDVALESDFVGSWPPYTVPYTVPYTNPYTVPDIVPYTVSDTVFRSRSEECPHCPFTKSDVLFAILCNLNIILSFIGNWVLWACT